MENGIIDGCVNCELISPICLGYSMKSALGNNCYTDYREIEQYTSNVSNNIIKRMFIQFSFFIPKHQIMCQ